VLRDLREPGSDSPLMNRTYQELLRFLSRTVYFVPSWGSEGRGCNRCREGKDSEILVRGHVENENVGMVEEIQVGVNAVRVQTKRVGCEALGSGHYKKGTHQHLPTSALERNEC
jgi:hypothetical protein